MHCCISDDSLYEGGEQRLLGCSMLEVTWVCGDFWAVVGGVWAIV
jgi:hypothetical protein